VERALKIPEPCDTICPAGPEVRKSEWLPLAHRDKPFLDGCRRFQGEADMAGPSAGAARSCLQASGVVSVFQRS
jgi:hypothetical protein